MAAAEQAEVLRADRVEGWPAPEEQPAWFGDPAAERVLLDALSGGRMHHAWLIGGPKGIGKATLAYRFARFALAHPNPGSAADATDLSLPADHPAFRRVAARAHPNLLTLERPWREDRKRFLTELSVDEIRRTVAFFGSTGGEGGWRIAVVDSADEMNASAANALLKVLEEPPKRAIFLIVTHAPGRLLPTIRSRCRRLELKPLGEETIVAALAAHGRTDDAGELALAARLAEGSLRRAIVLLDEDGIATYREFLRLVARLPDIDVPAMHAFADSVSRRGADDAWNGFLDLIRGWLGRRVRGEAEPAAGAALPPAVAAVPLARWAHVWEKVAEFSTEADDLNLDRKQVVLSLLMTLARAARM